jgi:anti-anti-sigma factor
MAVVTPPAGVDDRFGRGDSRIAVTIDHAQTGDYAAIVALHGEHDLATSEAMRVALWPLFGRVLVDLTSCEFIDSTIISLLMRKARGLERDGHFLELRVTPGSTIARTIRLAGVDRVVTIHST